MDKSVLLPLLDRPVAFHSAIARVAGGVTAGLMLCQLIYWSGKSTIDLKNDNWVKKEWRELELETALTQDEQRGARKSLLRRGLIQTERRGLDPVLWYRVDFNRLIELLSAVGNSHSDEGVSQTTMVNTALAKVERTVGKCTQTTSETTNTLGIEGGELYQALLADGKAKGKEFPCAWAESAVRKSLERGSLSQSELEALKRFRGHIAATSVVQDEKRTVAAMEPSFDSDIVAKGVAFAANVRANKQAAAQSRGVSST